MLLFFVVLMSWRLSGLVAHEWIGLALIALIFAHLIVHWGWVEATAVRGFRHKPRGRVLPLLLNALLFLSMGVALVSGVIISKIVFPNTLLPGDYMQWHELHESSSTITVFVLGLHVALNWDRIFGVLKSWFSSSHRSSPKASRAWRIRTGVLLRRAVWVFGLSIVLTGAVWAETKLVPSHPQVMMVFPDGHRALVSPPADISRVRPGTTAPDLSRGVSRFILTLVLLTVATLVGRYVFRLRLGRATRD